MTSNKLFFREGFTFQTQSRRTTLLIVGDGAYPREKVFSGTSSSSFYNPEDLKETLNGLMNIRASNYEADGCVARVPTYVCLRFVFEENVH